MTQENRPYTVVRSRHGWFWASWQDLTSTSDNLRTPTHEGWAASERAAHDAAREALGLGPYVGDLHRPGSNASRRTSGFMGASTGATLLRSRALKRRPAPPDAPGTETSVYQGAFHDGWSHGHPYTSYTPHRVRRTSARYVWVCDQSAAVAYDGTTTDAWAREHPEYLHTIRLDRRA